MNISKEKARELKKELERVNIKGTPEVTDELVEALFYMMNTDSLKFFYYFSQYISYVSSHELPTAGVTVNRGKLIMIYNPDFFKKLKTQEVSFVVMHEIGHALNHHLSADRFDINILDKHTLNCAMDYIINTNIKENNEYMRYIKIPEFALLLGDKYTKEYKGTRVTEPLYSYLIDNKEFQQASNGKGSCKEGQGQGKGSSDEGSSQQSQNKESSGGGPKPLDDHQFGDAMKDGSEKIAEEIVGKILDAMKNRGLVSANDKDFLDKIEKVRIPWMRLLMNSINDEVGFKKCTRSYSRLNRRGNFYLPGKKYNSSELTIVLDTSGSMGIKTMETVFGYIDKISSSINTTIIQIDAEIQGVSKYKKGMWKKFELKGRGGTCLQPALDLIKKTGKLNKGTVLMLTDGECDALNTIGIKRTVIATTHVSPKVNGRVKILKIEEEKDIS